MVIRTIALCLLGSLCLLGFACGGSSLLPAATDAHFREIQENEATLDQMQNTSLYGDCPDVCAAGTIGCDASQRICEIADSVRDLDAKLRCKSARDQCRQYQANMRRCRCASGS